MRTPKRPRSEVPPLAWSWSGLGVFERIVQGLRRMRNRLHDAPAVVVVAKPDGGVVGQMAGVERCADFVQRNPAPGEVDFGEVALLGYASDGHKFSSGNRNGEGWAGGCFGGEQGAYGVNSRRSQQNVPARGRSQAGRTGDAGRGNPAVILQDQRFRRGIIFARDDS